MITVRFEPGQTFAKADGLWKYDQNQDLYIEGLNLPANVEIDFSLANKTGQSIPVAGVTTGGVTKCAIPNSLLAADMSNDYTIYAYIYQKVGTGAETTHKIALGVKARPSRLGQDTPVDPNPFEDAIDQVNDAAARAEYAMALAEQEASAIKADRDQIQANKDGVAQLDTSVSALQAANVRYSSRFSNALIGHATGSGSVSVDDAAEATIPALEVAGRSEQVVTTGAQLFDYTQVPTKIDGGITFKNNGDGSFTVSGTSTIYASARLQLSLIPGTYAVSEMCIRDRRRITTSYQRQLPIPKGRQRAWQGLCRITSTAR